MENSTDHLKLMYHGRYLSNKRLLGSFQRHFSKWVTRYIHVDIENAKLIVETICREGPYEKHVDVFDLELAEIRAIDDPKTDYSFAVSKEFSETKFLLSVMDNNSQFEIWIQFETQIELLMWETKLKSLSTELRRQHLQKHLYVLDCLCNFINIQRNLKIKHFVSKQRRYSNLSKGEVEQSVTSKSSDYEYIVDMATKSSSIGAPGNSSSTMSPLQVNLCKDEELRQALKYIESSTSEAEYDVVKEENDFAIIDLVHSDRSSGKELELESGIDSIDKSKIYSDESDLSSISATLTEFNSECGYELKDGKPAFKYSTTTCSEAFSKTQIIEMSSTSVGAYESASDIRSNRQGLLRSLYYIPPPRMHIVILVVGTWGDVKPFIYMGRKLLASGQRVRLATHACFRDLVRAQGLEFYPLAGDPLKLSEFMVKNQGFIVPSTSDSLREVPQHLNMLSEIVHSCWDACVSVDHAGEDYSRENSVELHQPFRASAIISNPVTYGHMHCAEALNIPLHLMFPQPWLPTKAFPHPLSCLSYRTRSWSMENKLSYHVVDAMVWLTLHNSVNLFRTTRLGLPPINQASLHRRMKKIPFVKMWSPSLCPKPRDWPAHVDVVGAFTPTKLCSSLIESNASSSSEFNNELKVFLEHNRPPIFIGFGSMVIKDIENILDVLLQACAVNNVRVIFQSGWTMVTNKLFKAICERAQLNASLLKLSSSGGSDSSSEIFAKSAEFPKAAESTVNVDQDSFIVEHNDIGWSEQDAILITDCDHNILFPHVCGVVHHGGAGTTSAGLLAGCPTFIIPFFGDQFFWGELVRRKHLGPSPCSIKQLTLARAIESISYLLLPKTVDACKEMSMSMQKENGVESAIFSFYRHLPYQYMLCEVSLYMNSSVLAEVECKHCGGLRMSREVFRIVHSSSTVLSTHIPQDISLIGSTNIQAKQHSNSDVDNFTKDNKIQLQSNVTIISTIQRLTTKIGDRIKSSLFASTPINIGNLATASLFENDLEGEDGKFYNSDEEVDSESTVETDFDYDGDIANFLETSLTNEEAAIEETNVDGNLSTLNTKTIEIHPKFHFNLMEKHGEKSSTDQHKYSGASHSEYHIKRNEIIQAYQGVLQARQIYLSFMKSPSYGDCKSLSMKEFVYLFEQHYQTRNDNNGEDFSLDTAAIMNSFKYIFHGNSSAFNTCADRSGEDTCDFLSFALLYKYATKQYHERSKTIT